MSYEELELDCCTNTLIVVVSIDASGISKVYVGFVEESTVKLYVAGTPCLISTLLKVAVLPTTLTVYESGFTKV